MIKLVRARTVIAIASLLGVPIRVLSGYWNMGPTEKPKCAS